jgi:two-component system OmpR family response regulator
MRLLLVEDDAKLGQFVSDGLTQEGHVVEWVQDGEHGLARASSASHDAAIVDVMLPRLDGLGMVRELRRRRVGLPVIFLSARGSVDDRVAGLHAGGDDYVVKPFSFTELAARVHALLRRATTSAAEPTRLTYADLSLDLLTRRVTRGGRAIDLQGKELSLLELLLRNAERVLSRTMILERVWDYGFDPQTNVVDVAVSRLRAKVDRDFDAKLIHTIRGVGYVLRTD